MNDVIDYEKRCSTCVYGIFDMDHITTIPSIFICCNCKSEHYEDRMAWCSTCADFLSEDAQREIISAKWAEAMKGINNYYNEED